MPAKIVSVEFATCLDSLETSYYPCRMKAYSIFAESDLMALSYALVVSIWKAFHTLGIGCLSSLKFSSVSTYLLAVFPQGSELYLLV